MPPSIDRAQPLKRGRKESSGYASERARPARSPERLDEAAHEQESNKDQDFHSVAADAEKSALLQQLEESRKEIERLKGAARAGKEDVKAVSKILHEARATIEELRTDIMVNGREHQQHIALARIHLKEHKKQKNAANARNAKLLHSIQLLTEKAKAVQKTAADALGGLQCSICLDIMDSSVSTECGHSFHLECIDQWLQCERKRWPRCQEQCPVYRQPVFGNGQRNYALNDMVHAIQRIVAHNVSA